MLEMIVTEQLFIAALILGAVTFGLLIAWMLWEPDVRHYASALRRRFGSRRSLT